MVLLFISLILMGFICKTLSSVLLPVITAIFFSFALLPVIQFLKNKCKKPIIFVLNQMDKMKQKDDSIVKMTNDFYKDLTQKGFKNPKVIPVSAQAALLFKLQDDMMDEDDLFERELLKKKFLKDFYDLPSYSLNKKSSDLLERTGIPSLERNILTLIR